MLWCGWYFGCVILVVYLCDCDWLGFWCVGECVGCIEVGVMVDLVELCGIGVCWCDVVGCKCVVVEIVDKIYGVGIVCD